MDKYKCVACGYIYDDAVEEVKFADLPEDWVCPLCGVPKSAFVKVEEWNNLLTYKEKRIVYNDYMFFFLGYCLSIKIQIKNSFNLAGRYILCSQCFQTKNISTTWNYSKSTNYYSIL